MRPPEPERTERRRSFDDLFTPPTPAKEGKKSSPLADSLEAVLEAAGAQLPPELSADVAVAMVEILVKEFRRPFWTSDPAILVRIMIEAGEEKIRRLKAAREES